MSLAALAMLLIGVQALPNVYGPAIHAPGAPARAVLKAALPELPVVAETAANGIVYYYDNSEMTALDLRNARGRWRRRVDAYPGPGSFVATAHGIAFQSRSNPALVMLDAASGATRFSLPHTRAAGSIGGVLFAQDYQQSVYFALDERTGNRLWKSYGGGTQVNGAPFVRGGVLLQPYVDDGAILENVLYGFDPRTGHALWRQYAMNGPIGYRGNVAYIDSTWFPEQLDNYVPLTVASFDIVTGRKIDEYTYKPDPQQNAASYRNTPVVSYVSGGYVYLRVNGKWYRYDADRYPTAAHESRLQNLDIEAAFQGGALLVTRGTRAYIGHGTPSAMVLRPLPNGELRSTFVWPNGGGYALAGSILYRFDAQGNAQTVGSADCPAGATIWPWAGNVAVLCDGREFRFADATPAAAKLQVAAPQHPRTRLTLHAYDIPPHEGLMKQWSVGPIIPGENNGVVLALSPGPMNLASAIGFVSKAGSIAVVPIGTDVIVSPLPSAPARPTMPPLSIVPQPMPPMPTAIAFDKHGNAWFNDAWTSGIGKVTASREVTTRIVGVKQRMRGGLAIRLSIGPDGEAWFARSQPTRQIARADGSRVFDIPEGFGDALALASASDGLWFITQTRLGHVSLDGNFTGVDLPDELMNPHAYPAHVTATDRSSIWIASGSYIARMNERGVVSHYTLPDATLGVRAMVTACDGSLYVAETAPEVLRLPPNGTAFERYAIDYRELDGLTRTPDCTLWFVTGTNMPAGEQHVGTLSLVR
jgi:streptogramin lyase